MGTWTGGRHSFWLRPGLAVALVFIADLLLWQAWPGLNLALLSIAAVAAVAVTHRPAWSKAWPFLALALVFGLLQAETVSILGWLFICILLGVAVLAARAKSGDDVWRWTQRLIVLATGFVRAPIRAGRQLQIKRVRRRKGRSLPRLFALTALPLVGGLVFLLLFASANPLISEVLAAIRWPQISPGRLFMWLAMGLAAFALLRPLILRRPLAIPGEGKAAVTLAGVNAGSVTLSLIVFNLLFALQNGLDIAFLWSGARLPDDLTLAQYAHRGAYPLIATALLAGLFVLAALAPGTETSRRPLVRGLVIAWVAQNVFLVASSILRTLTYIEAFSLTRLRIAALVWMALVAVGLILICWRMLRGRSAAWLINANVLCAALVLAGFVVIDSGAVAANWNVRHPARSATGTAAIDVCYLARLGPSALVALSELERRSPPSWRRDQAARARAVAWDDLTVRQDDWRSWTWRGQRRLDQARAIAGAPSPPDQQPACQEYR